jgi:hypothetical protein
MNGQPYFIQATLNKNKLKRTQSSIKGSTWHDYEYFFYTQKIGISIPFYFEKCDHIWFILMTTITFVMNG